MYDSPHQFEPLLPAIVPPALLAKADEIIRRTNQLTAIAHPSARTVVRELVRAMNSYYSNRIEGQSTHPRHIERALKHEFSDRPDIAQLQRVALAHIDAERALEQTHDTAKPPLSTSVLIAAHHALYTRLAENDRTTEDGHLIMPGQLRTQDVQIGRHTPPAAVALPRFLARMDQVYARPMPSASLLIGVACCHHRAAWAHPFLDGNGRAVRLQSHLALCALSEGLWSPNRGLARSLPAYYARLHNADAARRGDYDGRGNLSSAGLLEWINFFLDICLDQVNFMSMMLALDGMKHRITALVTFRAAQDKKMRAEAILPLYHTFAAGPLTRAEFAQSSGLGERTARTLLAHLLATGLLQTDSPLGPVYFGLPLNALQFLLPELYPEADTLAI